MSEELKREIKRLHEGSSERQRTMRECIEKAAKSGKLSSVVLLPTVTTGAGLCGGSGNFRKLKDLQGDWETEISVKA